METLNENFLRDRVSLKRDPARNVALVKMRVANRSTLNLALPGANLIGPGEHTITVYEDQVEAIKGMVETDRTGMKEAQKRYDMLVAAEIQKKFENLQKLTIPKVVAVIKDGSDPLVMEQVARVKKESGFSVQAAFYDLNKRDMLPLDSAELIPNSEHAEPQREAVAADMAKLVAAAVAAIKQGQDAAPSKK